jgi:glycine/D-amino acid oxidase-like deaminating enzyme
MIAPIPLWREHGPIVPSPADEPQATGELGRRIDVVVVGAGIVGLTAALAVARASTEVLLVEGGPLGEGASTAGSGLVGWVPPRPDRTEIGPGRGVDLDASLRGAGEALVRRVAAAGWDADLVSPAGVVVGGSNAVPPLATVHPHRLLAAMAADLQEAGGAIAVHEPVRNISRHTTGYQVLTSRRKITATDVILATGGSRGPRPFDEIRRRMVTRRALVAATVPLSAERVAELVPPTITITRPARARWAAHATADRRIVVWHAAPPPAGKEGPWPALAAVTLPSLAEAEVTHMWRDEHALTADGNPRIGRINGMWYAVGGGDIALGAVAGDHVGGLVAGSRPRSPFAEIPHRVPRLQRLRRTAR